MGIESGIRAFEEMGFTRVEAEVYVYLVEHSPATGYAVAKAIGRTQGAAYKTLASLEARGAVEVDGGRNRLCRAVPPEELLERLDRNFQVQRSEAAAALREVQPSEGDDRIYRLKTVDQVYDRSRAMLAACRSIVILDLSPEPLATLRPSVEAVIRRGVPVLLTVYEEIDLPGAHVSRPPLKPGDADAMPLQWVSVFTDGRESLNAALSRDGRELHQAVWTANLLFSWGMGSYAKWSHFCNHLVSVLQAGADREAALAELTRWDETYPSFVSEGFKEMKRRFGLGNGNGRAVAEGNAT